MSWKMLDTFALATACLRDTIQDSSSELSEVSYSAEWLNYIKIFVNASIQNWSEYNLFEVLHVRLNVIYSI